MLFSTILSGEVDADAVLQIVLPLADVLVTVRERHGSVAVFFALSEVTFVGPSVLVGKPALAFEQVLGEGALVGALRFSEIVHS